MSQGKFIAFNVWYKHGLHINISIYFQYCLSPSFRVKKWRGCSLKMKKGSNHLPLLKNKGWNPLHKSVSYADSNPHHANIIRSRTLETCFSLSQRLVRCWVDSTPLKCYPLLYGNKLCAEVLSDIICAYKNMLMCYLKNSSVLHSLIWLQLRNTCIYWIISLGKVSQNTY